MTMKTSINDYQLKGNPAVDISQVPIIGNLPYDEVGEMVLAKFNEQFRGVRNIEDTTDYQSGQPVSYSNTPRALGCNTILRQEKPEEKIKVLSPEDVVLYWNAAPERDATYADTDSIVVFPKEGPNENLRQRVLGIIGKQSTKIPIIVSGLGVEKADNEYGFTFIGTDYMQVREAPFATQDQKVVYDMKKGIVALSEGKVNVWTPTDQSGLRGAFRYWGDGVSLWDGGLLGSSADGRVQVIQSPQDRAENLEEMTQRIQQLQEERERQITEINERYQQAERFLRTGKL